jgi:citrate synthase
MSSGSFVTAVLEQLRHTAELVGPFVRENGGRTVATVTLAEAHAGLKKPLLIPSCLKLVDGKPTPAHYVLPDTGFHLNGVPISERVAQGQTFEEAIGVLFLLREPTEDETESIRQILADNAEEFVSSSSNWAAVTSIAASFRDGFANSGNPPDAVAAAMACSGLVELEQTRLLTADCAPQITAVVRLHDYLRMQAAFGMIAAEVQRILFHRTNLPSLTSTDSRSTFADRYLRQMGLTPTPERLRVINSLLVMMCHHGRGNVSTNCALIANSAFGDCHQLLHALAAGNGANHIGAAAVGLRFLLRMLAEVEVDTSKGTAESLFERAAARLQAKNYLWCAGHGILANPKAGDPRERACQALCEELFPGNPQVALVREWYNQAINVLKQKDGVAFPSPNVDSMTGFLQYLIGTIPSVDASSCAALLFLVSRLSGACAEALYDIHAGWKGKPVIFRPQTPDLAALAAQP